MKITADKQCEHATTGGKRRVDIPVQGTPGLALRVTADGVKSWSLRYRRQSDHRLRRQTLGSYPDVKLADARERARKARNEVSDGNDPAGAKQARRAADTFQGLAEQWCAYKRRQGRADAYIRRNEERLRAMPDSFKAMKAQDVASHNPNEVGAERDGEDASCSLVMPQIFTHIVGPS